MIVRMNEELVEVSVKMACSLWPDADSNELSLEMAAIPESFSEDCLLYQTDQGHYVAWIQLSLRHDYVEGSSTSPVAYIEGIYVNPEYRRSGLASKLIEAGEKWALEKGCSELASDCELENELSIQFHSGYGFKEANRLVCFIKSL